jgi:hypothetical protein
LRREPVRLLEAAAATLAAGVVADSTTEHYRAGFYNPAMFVGPIVSAAALTSALSSTASGDRPGAWRTVVYAASIGTGLVGLGFHLTNVSRRPGGWSSANIFHGAPVAAPLAITMAGLLGLAAARVAAGRATPRTATAIGLLSAAGMIATSAEAAALHFRGAFQNPAMYLPVVVPPIAAATLATAVASGSSPLGGAARTLLRATTWVGTLGVGFHAWGVHRRMGGWRNWRQNLLAGPPLPAPPAFAALAIAGLASLELMDSGGDR